MRRTTAFALTLALAALPLAADDEAKKKHDCPLHAQHMAEAAARAATPAPSTSHAGHDVDVRGAEAMGFSQEKTRHTFRLTKDGGAIEVRAVDAADADSIARVRTHLADIARRFPAGDFTIPEMVHARVPEGVAVMQELRTAIGWRYEPLDRGGRVVITTRDARALEAIHAFLRFQISDHRTGDSGEVESRL